jgi:hypothetical protein
MNEARINLIKDLVQSCVSENADAQTNFAALDAKAQNTITVVGIFLAGALAFFTGDSLQKLIRLRSFTIIALFVAVISLLMISTIFCVWAMRIQYMSVYEASFSEELIKSILRQSSNELSARHENYLFGEVKEWGRLTREVRIINLRKANAAAVDN